MKWLFENSAKLIAVLSITLLIVATAHDWGYFLIVGPKFRSIQTTYDYVTEVIDWLPSFLTLTALAAAIAAIPISLIPNMQDGFEDRRNRITARIDKLCGIACVLLGVIFAAFAFVKPYPSNLVETAASLAAFYLAACCFTANAQMSPYRRLMAGSPAIVAAFFIWGVIDGEAALRKYTAHAMTRKGGETRQVSLLRTFEKGILVHIPQTEQVEFYRWDQIEALSHYVRAEREVPSCRLLKVFCQEAIEP